MVNLIQKTTRKSDWQIEEEARVARARAGHASFAQSMASQPDSAPAAQPARKAFLSGLGGTTDAPTAQTIALSQKADKLEALPVNAKRACERFDDDTKAFVNLVYSRHKETGEAVSFTASEAGAIMKRDAENARRCVEALVSTGILKASYSAMGSLKGYVPAITN